MNIQELRNKKLELEEGIADLINAFQTATECEVEKIKVESNVDLIDVSTLSSPNKYMREFHPPTVVVKVDL